MLIEISTAWLVVVNILAWLVLHLGVAWLGTRLPVSLFAPGQWLYRLRPWEDDGRVYDRLFRIKQWKDRLPDGAALFAGGFRKAGLRDVTAEYLDRFVNETCRGEAVHWVVLLSGGLFFLWNSWRVGLIMVAYAVIANMPCILAQRYNRRRLARIVARKKGKIESPFKGHEL